MCSLFIVFFVRRGFVHIVSSKRASNIKGSFSEGRLETFADKLRIRILFCAGIMTTIELAYVYKLS